MKTKPRLERERESRSALVEKQESFVRFYKLANTL